MFKTLASLVDRLADIGGSPHCVRACSPIVLAGSGFMFFMARQTFVSADWLGVVAFCGAGTLFLVLGVVGIIAPRKFLE